MRRRDFVRLALSTTGTAALSSCAKPQRTKDAEKGRRVLLLAFDGLNPTIVASLMAAGRLPNYQRLASRGSFRPLATCLPPHTPVAFSCIISGADPGVHQIFDFIHRDPNPGTGGLPVLPYFSTAKVESPEQQWTLPLGKWELPLSASTTQMLRQGPAFWDYLIAAGIDTDIFYLPSNYPTAEPEGPGRFRCISGMGTPDLLGGYGEFTWLTPDSPRRGRLVEGGRIVRLSVIGNRGQADLFGPTNHLQRGSESKLRDALKIPVDVVRDPNRAVAKITLSGETVLLSESQWSQWVPVRFQTGIPGSTVLSVAGAPTSVWGMVRIYLKQVHPKLEIYISPINIDPTDALNRISTPADFAAGLAQKHGRFSTVGIPEDTKALTHGALNESQFLEQVELGHEERVEQYRAALSEFKQGCLFFYFGSTDLVQHMFWRDRDPQHPGRIPEEAERYEHVIEETYVDTDRLVGEALDCLDEEDALIVLSDHGFNSFRRGFNLNSWLAENDYIRLKSPSMQGKFEMFANVDWSKTRVYGLGLNGLYINEAGREKHGVVKSQERDKLIVELQERLLETQDVDGTAFVDRVEPVNEIYPLADRQVAPDIILGYQEGYRASWETVLGRMPREIVVDNLDRWSGTHLISPEHVPGMLLTSFRVAGDDPSIFDIAPTILAAYGIECPEQMTGRSLFPEPTQIETS